MGHNAPKLAFFKQRPSNFLQWTPSALTVGGVAYVCIGQSLMVEIARLYKYHPAWQQIMESADPQEHNALGGVSRGLTTLFASIDSIANILHPTAIKLSLSSEQKLAIAFLLRPARVSSSGTLDLGPMAPLVHTNHCRKGNSILSKNLRQV